MLKRILYFGTPRHLSVKHAQLVITDKKTGEQQQAPVEDIGFVILDSPELTYTHAAMQKLTENKAAVVFCDRKRLPASLLLPLDGHQVQNERFRRQADASKALKKQLWQQTVKAKIRNQAALLKTIGENPEPLLRLARQVKSGDPDNQEAQASRKYWPCVFGSAFTRHRYGEPPNPYLNYIYAVLRAAVARALIGSGLLPTLGIHHRNKYNAYCLADDVMEPYRPFADRIVWQLMQEGPDEEGQEWHVMTPARKKELLQILNTDIHFGRTTRPLMVGLTQTTASLARCFAGEARRVKYPKL